MNTLYHNNCKLTFENWNCCLEFWERVVGYCWDNFKFQNWICRYVKVFTARYPNTNLEIQVDDCNQWALCSLSISGFNWAICQSALHKLQVKNMHISRVTPKFLSLIFPLLFCIIYVIMIDEIMNSRYNFQQNISHSNFRHSVMPFSRAS